jgi:dephospho-CoA kinase
MKSPPKLRPKTTKPPLVIGLTGGIASGKSTVAGYFEKLGGVVIDADAIVRNVLACKGIRETLARRWGKEFLDADGRPDRQKIAEVVFRSPKKLEEWTSWVHPPTRKKMRKQLENALKNSLVSFIIVDAPLLIEADLEAWCDAVVFVDADPSRRIERARVSRGWPDDEVRRRESAQLSLSEKRNRADAVISNNGSPAETFRQVKRLATQWMISPPSRTSKSQ